MVHFHSHGGGGCRGGEGEGAFPNLCVDPTWCEKWAGQPAPPPPPPEVGDVGGAVECSGGAPPLEAVPSGPIVRGVAEEVRECLLYCLHSSRN